MEPNLLLYREMRIIVQSTESLDEDLRNMLLSFIETKRNHPMIFGNLCIIHYMEFANNDENTEIYKIAAAVELLILSFDIFDDLQDNDTDYLWNSTPQLSMNAALGMVFITMKVIMESQFEHKLMAVQILQKYALKSINGQQLDLLNTCQDEKSYLNMIELKSGSLVTLSSLLGVVLAQGKIDERVKEYAKMIGVIQQIENDISAVLSLDGKNDFLNKKYSLPIIYFFKQKDELSQDLRDYYKGQVNSIDRQEIRQAMKDSGALRYAAAIKNLYKYRAMEHLNELSMSEESKHYIKYLMK